jgi:ADP-heptose:LPS heptosyltransferase
MQEAAEDQRLTSTDQTQRLLVIRAGALGDCLLMLPTLTALRAAFPRAHLDVMGYPGRWAWVLGRGLVDAVHAIEQPGMHLLFCEGMALPPDLVAFFRAYDLILSYRPDRDGLFTKNLRTLGTRLVLSQAPFPPPPPPPIHVADFALQLIAPLGASPLPRTPHLQLTTAELAQVQPYFVAHDFDPRRHQLVVVHPGSGSVAKRWPTAHFAVVIEALEAQAGVKCVVVTGYAEETLAAQMRSHLRHRQPLLAENWPLLPTAALIAQAAVFVGNDSGLTHLAATLGRPTVAIFGPTDPEVWGPRGEHVTIVQGQSTNIAEEQRATSALSHHRQMPDVGSVLRAVQDWLARATPRQNRDDQAGQSSHTGHCPPP